MYSSPINERHYHDIFAQHSLIFERRIDYKKLEIEKVVELIERKQWKCFVHEPNKVVPSMVKEFYANFVEKKDNRVHVRNKLVLFSTEEINHFFDLETPNEEKDYYTALCRDDSFNLDFVTMELYGTLAKCSNSNVIHGRMTNFNKVFNLFISHSIIPTKHQSDVTKDRAILLYSISSKGSFNHVITSIRRWKIVLDPNLGVWFSPA